MQRSTMAAALRAQAREKQRLVDSGVLNERFFAGETSRAKGSGDARPVRPPQKTKLSRGKRAKARAIGGDEDDDDDDDDVDDEDQGVDALENDESGDELERPSGAGRRSQETAYEDQEDELLRLQKEDRSDVPLEAFNLAKERSQGYFDKSGNYVLTRKDLAHEDDDDQVEDWVNNEIANAANIKDASMSSKKRPRPVVRDPRFHVQQLVDLLKDPDETVLKALARLGKAKNKDMVDRVTESANALMDAHPDVYQSPRRKLDAQIAESRAERMENHFWQYQTGDGETYGPYNASAMQAWRDAGYFDGENKDNLRFRRTTAPNTDNDGADTTGNDAKRRKVIFAKSAKDDLAADFDDFDDDDDDDGDAKVQDASAKSDQKAAQTSAPNQDAKPWLPLSAVSFSQVFE
ncbi:CD2 antigen cytoplasmic tail-binding protein 2 [Hondaea fermentalgiana]|uniref:CD2 antigen cytoplasmic tail-binding protein 2 n=1 Tax=Hondaea fermentalgiana TaxID=2315210 RepID=A0A2R5GM32_9STRA|nr:CD2 antigen cytoplasmic tail-binding protein 2 [Hondaea fermentalgiana]|eukprot:GBG30798.1 CD2 antigen cytoplasmic tail-binding protein 2 [Hondaea fermentalgiana]